MPKDVPEVVVGISQAANFRSGTGFLRLPGAEHLAMVNVVHRPPCSAAPPLVERADTIPRAIYQPMTPTGSGGGSAIRVDLEREFYADPLVFIGYPSECLKEENRFRWWDIHFVLAGSPWPYDPDWSELESALQGTAFNVTNGTGFLGGVITRTVPFERCYIVGGASFAPFCELTYSARSASVEGFVRDASCPGGWLPLDSTTVFLWEDDKEDLDRTTVIRDLQGASITLRKPDGVKVRAGYTDRDGSYRIEALEPGVPYAISVTRSGYVGDGDRFVPQAGQTVRLDLDLVRPNSTCGS